MKILFITAHRYLPQMHGGSQSSTHYLCHGLIEKGHSVAVLAALGKGGLFSWEARLKMRLNEKRTGHKIARDTRFGYPVWYAWFPWEEVDFVAQAEKPDVIVVMAYMPVKMALAARSSGIRTLVKLEDVQFDQHGGDFKKLGNIPCVANSNFTASRYREVYGVNPTVIHPLIPPKKYKVEPKRQNITFINPLPVKGRDIALEIARLCPEIPFSFIEAWPLSKEYRAELTEKLTPNVTLHSARNDMKSVYGKSKILLMPSLWEEGYGRVITEAQLSGIPAVASARGGLPEAVGPGGILLDIESSAESWAASLRKLWSDQNYYAELSARAVTHAGRPEMVYDNQLKAWEKILAG